MAGKLLFDFHFYKFSDNLKTRSKALNVLNFKAFSQKLPKFQQFHFHFDLQSFPQINAKTFSFQLILLLKASPKAFFSFSYNDQIKVYGRKKMLPKFFFVKSQKCNLFLENKKSTRGFFKSFYLNFLEKSFRLL